MWASAVESGAEKRAALPAATVKLKEAARAEMAVALQSLRPMSIAVAVST